MLIGSTWEPHRGHTAPTPLSDRQNDAPPTSNKTGFKRQNPQNALQARQSQRLTRSARERYPTTIGAAPGRLRWNKRLLPALRGGRLATAARPCHGRTVGPPRTRSTMRPPLNPQRPTNTWSTYPAASLADASGGQTGGMTKLSPARHGPVTGLWCTAQIRECSRRDKQTT
jgi:hypothetical protein